MNAPARAWKHRMIGSNGIRLHVRAAGAEEGQPVLLLHGIPEFWYVWKKSELAESGLSMRCDLLARDTLSFSFLEKRVRFAAAPRRPPAESAT